MDLCHLRADANKSSPFVDESFVLLPVPVLDELVRTLALTPCWMVPKRRRVCSFRIMCK